MRDDGGMTERRPRWIYDAGEDPDPRFSLANERTFLAWVRTALALLAGAVALFSLGVPEHRVAREGLVVALMVLGIATVVMAAVRWMRTEHAMRTRGPLPPLFSGLVMSAGLAVVGLVLLVAVLT
jgi:putative membrane protein